MKHTILSALLTSAGLSAATVSGVIHDSNSAPIPDAKVILLNPDTSARQEAVTDASGKFSFTGSSAGQYILRIEKPGFTSLFREFDAKGDSKVDNEFTLEATGEKTPAEAAVGNPPVNGEPPKIVRIGGAVAQSNLISKVPPVYPVAAKTARVQGTVELQATISKDGVPLELRVLSSPSDDLSQSSLEAVRQWRYRPTLLNGNPVEIVTVIIVNYTLSY
jgi:TonB family protein